jgi:hypothetical protein
VEKSFFEAEKYCNGLGGHLASFANQSEYDFITKIGQSLIPSFNRYYDSYWIGLTNDGKPLYGGEGMNRFKLSFTDGTPVPTFGEESYGHYWGVTHEDTWEPNGSDGRRQNCMEITTRTNTPDSKYIDKMDDTNCHVTRVFFVVELKDLCGAYFNQSFNQSHTPYFQPFMCRIRSVAKPPSSPPVNISTNLKITYVLDAYMLAALFMIMASIALIYGIITRCFQWSKAGYSKERLIGV